MCARALSCAQLFATPWTAARQAPLSMGSPRWECGSGSPFPPPEDLPDPGLNLHLLSPVTGRWILDHRATVETDPHLNQTAG